MYCIFEIPLAPLPKKRHRNGRFGTYDPQSKEKQIWHLCIEQILRQNELSVPEDPGIVILDATYYVPIPKSLSNKRKDLLEGVFCASRPDVDNYTKWLMDVGTGILWPDDNIIVRESGSKVYSFNPRISVKIEYRE